MCVLCLAIRLLGKPRVMPRGYFRRPWHPPQPGRKKAEKPGDVGASVIPLDTCLLNIKLTWKWAKMRGALATFLV